MVANVTSCTLDGIDAVVVEVECEISKGLPNYNVVGLAVGDAVEVEFTTHYKSDPKMRLARITKLPADTPLNLR